MFWIVLGQLIVLLFIISCLSHTNGVVCEILDELKKITAVVKDVKKLNRKE